MIAKSWVKALSISSLINYLMIWWSGDLLIDGFGVAG
jgi:hypothetical protein